MKDSTSLSAPQRGMNRDYNPATLNNTQYSMALNACVENEDDNMMLIQNEPSNLLCSRLEGYKAIGYRIDLDAGCTYFFCVKERASEKGGRKNDSRLICFESTEFIEGVDDVETGSGIDIEKILAEPLETSENRYEEICASPIKILLTDEYCEDGSSLNFDLCHPIKTIEIKTEKCGKCIYWTDGYNPPRFLNLSKLEPADGSPSWYSYLGEPECGDYSSTTPVCLAVDKLRIFPLRSIPCIDVAGLEYGGHLRAGVYQFCIAICDSFGNEITSYNSLTAPTHVFNDGQRTIRGEVGSSSWGTDTNYGIRLKIHHLDEYAAYYKVCVIQTTVGPEGEENIAEEYFVLGTFPVSQQTIYYMGDQTLVRTTLAHLAVEKPVYLTAEGMTTSDQKLLMYGLTVENEWNLQPIANLLGSFLYWQTSSANENLYKDGANVSKYMGYMRDEVYPFGIRFITGDGYKTAIFTLVPPPPKPEDVEEVVEMVDGEPVVKDAYSDHETEIMSVLKNVPICADVQRTKYWQFFNTAKSLGPATWGQEEGSNGECDEVAWGTKRQVIKYPYATYNPEEGIDMFFSITTQVTEYDLQNNINDVLTKEIKAACAGEKGCNAEGSLPSIKKIRVYFWWDATSLQERKCVVYKGEEISDDNKIYEKTWYSDQLYTTYKVIENYAPITRDYGLAFYFEVENMSQNQTFRVQVIDTYSGTITKTRIFSLINNIGTAYVSSKDSIPVSYSPGSRYEEPSGEYEEGESSVSEVLCDILSANESEDVQPWLEEKEYPTFPETCEEPVLTTREVVLSNTQGLSFDYTYKEYGGAYSSLKKDEIVIRSSSATASFVEAIYVNDDFRNYVGLNESRLICEWMAKAFSQQVKKDYAMSSRSDNVSLSDANGLFPGRMNFSGSIGVNDDCSKARSIPLYDEHSIGVNTKIVHGSNNVAAFDATEFGLTTNRINGTREHLGKAFKNIVYAGDFSQQRIYWLKIDGEGDNKKVSDALRNLLYGVDESTNLSINNEGFTSFNASSYDQYLVFPGYPFRGQESFMYLTDWISTFMHFHSEQDYFTDNNGNVWRSFGVQAAYDAGARYAINGHFFHQQINKGALWYKIEKPDFFDYDSISEEDKYLNIDCGGASFDDIYKYRNTDSDSRISYSHDYVGNTLGSSRVRITFFYNCNGAIKKMPYYQLCDVSYIGEDIGLKRGHIFNIEDQVVFSIKPEDFIDENGHSISEIYMAVEPAIYVGLFEWFKNAPRNGPFAGTVGVTFATCEFASNYIVCERPREICSLSVHVDEMYFDAEDTYEAQCQVCVDDKIGACSTSPKEYGSFGYWESTDLYPVNEYLFDSSKIKITKEATGDLYSDIKKGLSNYQWVGDSVAGAKLCGQPIRHYKFPGNNLVPFMDEMEMSFGSKAAIYPISAVIDDNIVQAFLNIAVDNGIITQKQRDRITGYEIYRGDRTLHKSILGTGLGFDVWKYKESISDGNKLDYYYSNYPYNDLHDDEYIYEDSKRENYMSHPFNKEGNNKYSFYSPDYLFFPGTTATEIQLEGFQVGKSANSFPEMLGHSKWVLPSKDMISAAQKLAFAQAAADNASNALNIVEQTISGAGVGASVGGGWGAAIAAILGGAASVLAQMSMTIFSMGATYMINWIKLFTNLGTLRNFAYYHTSYANYNSFYKNSLADNTLRGIALMRKTPSGMIFLTDKESEDGVIRYNNRLRETSEFISLGDEDYKYLYDSVIKDYDKSRIEDGNISLEFSKPSSGSSTMEYSVEESAIANNDDREVSSQYYYGSDIAPVASPYFKVKNYVADQYGTIDDIKWLPVGVCGAFNEEEPMRQIFGGDVYISRFSPKRQFPFFYNSAYSIGDMVPFEYLAYRNVGYPKYYVNFNTEKGVANYESAFSKVLISGTELKGLPYPTSSFELSQEYRDRDKWYLNGKFYTASYGNPMFLVESTINCWYRLATSDPKGNYYPNVGDYIEWTQEKNVPIGTDNQYLIDNSYIVAPHSIGTRKLPSTYDKAFYDCAYQMPNGVAWSKPDLSENDQTDPWLTYKYFDKFEFPSKNGKLIHLKGIEAQQILARFENQVSLYNAIDVLKGRLGENEADLGTGGLFAARPMEYNRTDLGYTGSQSTEMISNEFGHFWVDAKRANIFRVDPNGTGLEEITTGIRLWIREHLPFKIMRYGITVQEGTSGESHQLTYRDIDNKFMGIGISMGWDNKRKTLYVTKKDYIPVQDASNYTFKDCRFYYDGTEVKVSDPEYFKDVSFTIAYNCLKKEWVSYMSYHPDYYVEHLRYFQTGLNWSNDEDEVGLWSHLLTNQSYQVFYGKLYPFIVEVPDKEEYMKKMLSDFRYEMDARRYHNRVEWAQKRLIGFNKAYIYNATNHSGLLNLVPEEKNNMKQKIDYPKTNEDSRDILVTEVDGRWNINDFFNQTTNDLNNVSLWNKDENDIIRDVNLKAITYNKVWNDRLKGDWFLIRLINDKESRFKLVFKWTFNQNKAYL